MILKLFNDVSKQMMYQTWFYGIFLLLVLDFAWKFYLSNLDSTWPNLFNEVLHMIFPFFLLTELTNPKKQNKEQKIFF